MLLNCEEESRYLFKMSNKLIPIIFWASNWMKWSIIQQGRIEFKTHLLFLPSWPQPLSTNGEISTFVTITNDTSINKFNFLHTFNILKRHTCIIRRQHQYYTCTNNYNALNNQWFNTQIMLVGTWLCIFIQF